MALRKSVTELIAYNKSISDSAGATGMGVEELSRFVQVADDFGISMDSVTRSLELATKNGFTPTISNIAALADQTNAMNDPTERAAYLAGILGRNWAELDPILRSGGEAIKAKAAAQADGLVVTQAEIDASEKLRLQLDELSDSWTSLANVVGSKAIPVLSKYIDSGNATIKASVDLNRAVELGIVKANDANIAWGAYGRGFPHMVEVIQAAIMAHDASSTALYNETGRVEELRNAVLGLPAYKQIKVDTIKTTIQRTMSYEEWLAEKGNANVSYQSYQALQGSSGLTTPGHGTPSAPSNESYARRAAGGPLSGVNEVGERGTEGIVNGVVIPHDPWEWLKRAGMVGNARHFQTGGDMNPLQLLELGDFEEHVGPQPVYDPDIGDWAAAPSYTGGGKKKKAPAFTGGGKSSAATSAAMVSMVSVPAAVAVAGEKSAAATREVAQAQAAAIAISNANLLSEVKEMRKEIAKLNRTLPTAFRDSVERML